MTRRAAQRWYRLNDAFVAAARTALQDDRVLRRAHRTLSDIAWVGGIIGREASPEARRFQRIADEIGYTGSIFGEVAEVSKW